MRESEKQMANIVLLEILTRYKRTRRELERRQASASITEVQIELSLQLDDVRGRIKFLETRLEKSLHTAPFGVARRIHQVKRKWAVEEIDHLRKLRAIRQRKSDELEIRVAAYGPGEAPLHLINCLQAEQAALDRLDERLSQIRARLFPCISLITPDGTRYKSQVPSDITVANLLAKFLEQLGPSSDSPHFSLRCKPDSRPLETRLRLDEACIQDGDVLLVEPIQPADSQRFSLMVEDEVGNRFEAQVTSDTRLDRLTADFIAQYCPDKQGQTPIIELVRAGAPDRASRLRSDQTVREAKLEDGDVLCISSPPGEQGQPPIIELVSTGAIDRVQQLRGDQTVREAGLKDGAVLRISTRSGYGKE